MTKFFASAVVMSLGVLPCATVGAAEAAVSWSDPTCGYFVLKMPEGNPKEAFGLFSVKTPPVPKVDDVIAGDIETAQEPSLSNKTSGVSHEVIHWANAKEQAMLVRNTPVQCASRWKKKN